jgi:F0F1-type ATP synthase assembly protein I
MALTRFQKSNIFKGILLAIGLGYLSYDFWMKGKYGMIVIIVLGGIALGVMLVKGKQKE